MNSVYVITDQKKRLLGQTMELEKLKIERNGKLHGIGKSVIIVPIIQYTTVIENLHV